MSGRSVRETVWTATASADPGTMRRVVLWALVGATGISFVHQFFGIFAPGITPIAATALRKSGGGQPLQICMYVIVVGIISAVSAAFIGHTAGRVARPATV